MAVERIDAAEILWRGEPGYEETRAAGWNRRVPERFPDVIVRPASADEVAAAVRLARSRGMRIAVRAGGHSMCAASLHDNGMLIDLSRLREIRVDADSRTASVQPAVTSAELLRALAPHGLAFPVAHHGSVALSGFLLAGGQGWNAGVWGPACASVRAVEVINAEGNLTHADDRTNPELLSAARGAGPEFAGVATRLHLDVHPLPGGIQTSMSMYPLAEVEAVSRWAADMVPSLPPSVELLLALLSAPPGAPAGPAGKVVGVIATAFEATGEEAARSLAVVDTCPVSHRALRRDLDHTASFETLFDAIGRILPAQHRYCEESLWSDRDVGAVLPRLAEAIVGAPSNKSVILTAPLGASLALRPQQNAAYVPAGQTFALCYGIWTDESDDAANQQWLDHTVAGCASLATGRYVGETDVVTDAQSSAPCFTSASRERLSEMRRRCDPDGVFPTWRRDHV